MNAAGSDLSNTLLPICGIEGIKNIYEYTEFSEI